MNGDNTEDLHRDFGRLEGRMTAVEASNADIKKTTRDILRDLSDIKETLNQARGGWKTLMLVAGFSSLFGALFAKAGGLISLLPK